MQVIASPKPQPIEYRVGGRRPRSGGCGKAKWQLYWTGPLTSLPEIAYINYFRILVRDTKSYREVWIYKS